MAIVAPTKNMTSSDNTVSTHATTLSSLLRGLGDSDFLGAKLGTHLYLKLRNRNAKGVVMAANRDNGIIIFSNGLIVV
jgi:hypothetical protein